MKQLLAKIQGNLLFVLSLSILMALSVLTVLVNNNTKAATNLVAAYSFDEAGGTTVNDVSGTGNTGTINGATRTTTGKYGGAMSFDGVNDWVTVNDHSSLDLTNRMTLEAWVRPNNLQNWPTIMMKERSGGISYGLYGSNGTNRPPAVYAYVGNERSAVGTSNLPLNTWTHIAGTYDGASIRLYVNGNLVRTVSRTGNITTSNNPLRIGGNSVWGEYFNGSIDDVRIHSAVLTQAEIQTDMNTPVSPPAPDTNSPSVPANLTANAVSQTQVNLSWNASTDNVGVTGYRILRDGGQVGTSVATSFSNTGLNPGTTYMYTVRAVDAAGNVSADSIPATVTTQAPDTTPPSTPTNLNATAVSSTQVNLSWTASTDNIGVTGYRLLRNGTQIATPSGTTFNDTTASAGTTYSYIVRAVDAAGNVSADSDAATVTTPTPDITAPIVSITNPVAGSTVNGAVTIEADASDNVGVSGVQFFVNGSALGSEDASTPYSASWDTSGLTAGSYAITARASDVAGNTTTSDAVNVTITGDFSFTVQQSSITLPSSGDGFYEIDIAYLNGFTSSNIDLWVQDLPAGVSGRYLFDPLVHQGTTEFLVTTEGIAEGTYTFTLGATDNGGTNLTHSQQVTLIVDNTPDFSLQATPQIQNVIAGGSVDYALNVTPSAGFSSSVSFAALGLPAGATAIFTPTNLTPPGTANVRISTSATTPPGQYTITINGTGDGITRSIQVLVNVTSNNATWNVSVMGSTGTQNNTVRLGKVRTDGLNRVYVGTIGTGRVLEYNWNGTNWSGAVDVGGSPAGQEIHDMTIGNGRGDGQDRIYAASYDNKVYEIWHNGTSWQQLAVATLDNLGMHAAVGDGRGDGVNRLYLISTQSLYEYTWNGSSWAGGKVGNTPGAHGLIVASPRGTGQMGVYVASISSGSFEGRWNGSSWTVASMGDTGDVRNIYVGNARNDGVNRVYGALLDGRLREYTWNGTGWSIIHGPAAPGGLIHSYILAGRNDGVNRIYSSATDGKVYESTWNGSSWGAPVNMGGGSDYMYGQHFGDGRNDGITRIYSADRGSVNRVYEYAWTASVADSQAPTAPTNVTSTGGIGTASLSWTAATDNIGVAQYNIHRSTVSGFVPGPGNKVGQTTGLSFNQNGLANGTYYYVVTAQDGAGNISPASNEVAVSVTGDTENPTVSLTSPANGATLSNTVNLSATASDNNGLAGVTFLVDGVAIGSEDTTAPYSVAWNTSTASNGSHSLTARARDNANNTALSSPISVTVNNTAPSNLIASYSFNEGTGGTANDGAGGDNTGTITSALWNTGGRYGNALSFDGNGDMVTINDANNLDLITGMTLEAWVRPNSLSGWTTALLKEGGNTMSYALYASDNTNQPPAGYVQIGGDQAVRGTGVLAIGTWTHIATTFDGSVMRMYVNGTQVASRNLSGSISTSTGALRIGGNAIWGEYFNGLIDEVRVYNRALSSAEIQSDMNTPL